LLEISFGTAAYALRKADISGLFVDRIVTPLPTAVPALLGITGVRGEILPVYDLGAMLGYPVRAARWRWLAIAAGTPVGLAFERFARHVRVRRDAVVPQQAGRQRIQHVSELVRVHDRLIPVVSVVSILDALPSRGIRPGALTEER